jgi:hypothetical protein
MAPTLIVKGKQSDPYVVKEQFEALNMCLTAWGPAAFMSYFFWILGKTTNAQGTRYLPFQLNRIQKDLIENLSEQNLLLKARQMGGTTFMMLYRLLLPAITQYGFRGLFVSQKQSYANQHFLILDRARRLLGMVRQGAGPDVNHLAEDLRKNLLKLRLGNRRELLFENLDSSVFVDTSENRESGQGFCGFPDMVLVRADGSIGRFGDLKVGNVIIGDDGMPVRVSKTFVVPIKTHPYKGKAVRVGVVGFKELSPVVAPNHPFETQHGMVEAQYLTKKHYIAYPKRKLITTLSQVALPTKDGYRLGKRAGASMRLTRDVGFVCGFYLADGSVQGKNAVIFPMMNPRKILTAEPRLRKFFNRFVGMREQFKIGGVLKDGTQQKKRYLVASSTVFNAWLRKNLGWARTKHFPDWWADAPQEFLVGMLEGLFTGDGDWVFEKNSVVLSSTNDRLIGQAWQIIMSLGWGVAGIWAQNKPDTQVEICGVLCNRRGKRYKLSVYGKVYECLADAFNMPLRYKLAPDRRKSRYETEDRYFIRVSGTESTTVDEFFDITVDNKSHKYLLPAGITHNTINGFVGSEFSRWAGDPAETLANIRGSLAPHATQDLECTANGAQGPFYKLVNLALNKEGVYRLNFYEWWWTDEYRLDMEATERASLAAELARIDELVLTEKETRLKQESLDEQMRSEYAVRQVAHLTLAQIAWRRGQIAADPRAFRENYPEDARSCFLIEGNSYFDNEILARRELELRIFKPYKISRQEDAILFWKPRPNVEYMIGADVAEGVPSNEGGTDLDYNCAWVIEKESGMQVAHYRSRYRADKFAYDLAYLGLMYNNAMIAVERNSYGAGVILFLERGDVENDMPPYTNLYAHPHIDRLSGEVGNKLGFPTNVSTRPIALSYLRKWAEDNPDMIFSEVFCNQALSFVNRKGKPQAAPGAHDDSVAAGWVAHGARAYHLGFWVPVRSRKNSDDEDV